MRSNERSVHTEHTRLRRAAAAVAGLTLLVASCGSDAEPAAVAATDAAAEAPEAPAAEAPATEAPVPEAPVGTDAMAATPERVVSLSPTATEMMFAIGAGDLLVAVDQFSNYPAEALDLPNELSGFEPNVEAIAAYEPDLVLTGGDFTGLGEQLDSIDIAWWDGPAAVDLGDVYSQIEQLGAATGHADEAAGLVQAMEARVAAAVASAPDLDEPLTFYHELDNTLYSLDSTTFVGDLYSMLGLQNIADRAEGESFGYPQLNAEFLVSANPDMIFLADTKCCAETAVTVAERDGWSEIAAVQNGAIFEMDDDIASRWGPRIVEYLEAVAAAVRQMPANQS